jgi:hypothetical protein
MGFTNNNVFFGFKVFFKYNIVPTADLMGFHWIWWFGVQS